LITEEYQMSDTKTISEADALKMKRDQTAAPGAVKTWRATSFPMTPQQAVDFVNAEPRQGPGEAAFILLPNGVTVVYLS
jgi:hypothetical protein